VVAEQPFVVGEQPALAHRGRGLQGRHQARPLGDAQHVLAAGDGAAGHENDAAPAVHELRHVAGQAGEERRRRRR